MDQKIRFIADYQRHFFSLSELCSRFGISRKTAYKWIARYESAGPVGLKDRSRRPHACPHQTPSMVVEALLEFRRRHPSWGAKKLRAFCLAGSRLGNGHLGVLRQIFCGVTG